MDDLAYAGHMLDAAQRIRRKVRGVTRPAFDADDTLQLALTHLIQVVGAAASRTSAVFREAHPEVPWAQIIGMRNRIVHDYEDVNLDVVWRVVTEDVEALVAALDHIVPPAQR